MVEALISGKLSREQENMEDLLTSTVFGLLKCAPFGAGLFTFLAKAKTIDGDFPLKVLTEHPAELQVTFRFWPRWTHCEPDVELLISREDGTSLLVGIEAKYLSGKSSEASEDGVLDDQLALECRDLVAEANRRNAKPVFVYLTADVCIPRAQIKSSIEDFERTSSLPRPVICWLTWRYLQELFVDTSIQGLIDLRRLADRLGLGFFQGIGRLSEIRAQWMFNSPTGTWRIYVAPIVCQWRFTP